MYTKIPPPIVTLIFGLIIYFSKSFMLAAFIESVLKKNINTNKSIFIPYLKVTETDGSPAQKAQSGSLVVASSFKSLVQ